MVLYTIEKDLQDFINEDNLAFPQDRLRIRVAGQVVQLNYISGTGVLIHVQKPIPRRKTTAGHTSVIRLSSSYSTIAIESGLLLGKLPPWRMRAVVKNLSVS